MPKVKKKGTEGKILYNLIRWKGLALWWSLHFFPGDPRFKKSASLLNKVRLPSNSLPFLFEGGIPSPDHLQWELSALGAPKDLIRAILNRNNNLST
jgi:hypothetical protein